MDIALENVFLSSSFSPGCSVVVVLRSAIPTITFLRDTCKGEAASAVHIMVAICEA